MHLDVYYQFNAALYRMSLQAGFLGAAPSKRGVGVEP